MDTCKNRQIESILFPSILFRLQWSVIYPLVSSIPFPFSVVYWLYMKYLSLNYSDKIQENDKWQHIHWWTQLITLSSSMPFLQKKTKKIHFFSLFLAFLVVTFPVQSACCSPGSLRMFAVFYWHFQNEPIWWRHPSSPPPHHHHHFHIIISKSIVIFTVWQLTHPSLPACFISKHFLMIPIMIPHFCI